MLSSMAAAAFSARESAHESKAAASRLAVSYSSHSRLVWSTGQAHSRGKAWVARGELVQLYGMVSPMDPAAGSGGMASGRLVRRSQRRRGRRGSKALDAEEMAALLLSAALMQEVWPPVGLLCTV